MPGSGYCSVVFVAMYEGRAAPAVITCPGRWNGCNDVEVRAAVMAVNQSVGPGYDQEARQTVCGVSTSALLLSRRLNFEADRVV